MQPKPHILILSTAYLPLVGGSELAIRHLTDRLAGYDFDMVTGRYHDGMPVSEQVGRIRVFRAGGRLSRLTLILPKALMPLAIAATALRLMRRYNYAAVHAYQASQAGGAAWLIKMLRPRTPLIVTIQEGKELDRQSILVRWMRQMIFRSADRITAISSYLADYVRRFTKTHIDIVPNGVDVAKLSVTRPITNPEPTILTVSRLVSKNNVEGVIRAFAIVKKSIVNAKLLIVGEGELLSRLQHVADELGIRQAVHFMGTVAHDDLPAIYAMADVFVRPSLSEGLGNVFLEAMAARVPVVASDVGGITDFLEDEVTGLACNPKDSADIASRIIRLLEDVDLRKAIVDRAYAMVADRYDWNAVAARMDAVYKEVIQ